jgi:hypothetical protein
MPYPPPSAFVASNFNSAMAIKSCADHFNPNAPLPDDVTCRIVEYAKAFAGASATASADIFLPNEDWTNGAYLGNRGTFFADVTGDGKADAIVVNDQRVTVRRSNGSAFEPNEDWTSGPYFGSRGTFFVDVTGDVKADAIVVNDQRVTIRRSPDILLRQSNGAIWVIYGGAKFHVPNGAILNELFPNIPARPVTDGEVAEIPDTPRDGTLLREANGAIWVVYGGAKFHVPTQAIVDSLIVTGATVHQLWDGALANVPDIPRDGTLLREQSSTQIYVIASGHKTSAPVGVAGTEHILWDGALNQVP